MTERNLHHARLSAVVRGAVQPVHVARYGTRCPILHRTNAHGGGLGARQSARKSPPARLQLAAAAALPVVLLASACRYIPCLYVYNKIDCLCLEELHAFASVRGAPSSPAPPRCPASYSQHARAPTAEPSVAVRVGNPAARAPEEEFCEHPKTEG